MSESSKRLGFPASENMDKAETLVKRTFGAECWRISNECPQFIGGCE